jgi:excinuclease ABC subunit C
MFLQGRQQDVIGSLSAAMDQAAAKLAFEQAAVYRDQIQSLRQVQEKQYVESGKAATWISSSPLKRAACPVREPGDGSRWPASRRPTAVSGQCRRFVAARGTDRISLPALSAHPIPPRILVNLALS